jgi:hypothetical protein
VLLWIGGTLDAGKALGAAALVAIPHLLVDDGRGVEAWMRVIKHTGRGIPMLNVAVDQSFHVVCLTGAALLTTA